MKHRICLIEDDELLGDVLADRLRLEGYACDWYRTGHTARTALHQKRYSAVISDIRLPDLSGEQLYVSLGEEGVPLPPFLFITGHGAIDQAVRLLKLGAEDYLTKPFDVLELLAKLRRLCVPVTADDDSLGLGVSAAMCAIETTLRKLAPQTAPLLVTGESGVGKEWVARCLHRLRNPDGKQPFVAINCSAIPESLMEAELFGYEKGAFTGAIKSKRGYFEQANGGTLFLDEIGDMPITLQTKLLRVIQERVVTKVGAEQPIAVEFNLICATHCDLKAMVERNEFREDLYYRIHVVEVHVPPLRERPDDILWFARAFVDEFSSRAQGRAFTLHPRTEEYMLAYAWPGNIRELRHSIERACILSAAPVLTPEVFSGDVYASLDDATPATEASLCDYLYTCEAQYIRRMLTEHDGRIADTADALGISRKNLWEKMRKLGIERNDASES